MKKLFYVKPGLHLPDNITIVGSSKSILKKKYGKKIEKAKFIVRFNFAKTKGFEKHTGSRTNLMVINNNAYNFLENGNKRLEKIKKYLIISPFELKKFRSNLNLFFFEKKKNQYLLVIKLANNFGIFLSILNILIRRKTLSVGFCFIILCILSGIKLDIYGFDLNEDMLKRKHYYKRLKIGNIHDLVAEHKILNKLKHHDLINFRY